MCVSWCKLNQARIINKIQIIIIFYQVSEMVEGDLEIFNFVILPKMEI